MTAIRLGSKAKKENAMAPPPLFGYFTGNIRRPQSVRKWVLENVPCFAGPVPDEWTKRIYSELRKDGVNTDVISVGLALARQDGYVFNDYHISLHDYTPRPVPLSTPPPSMQEAAPPTIEDLKQQAAIIDSKYEFARANHNIAQMESLANILLDLLKGYLQTRRDKDKFDQVREEILLNARNIAPIIRRVEREGPSPPPGGGRLRQVSLHEYILEDAGEDAEREDAE
jgi:hypothetical protein